MSKRAIELVGVAVAFITIIVLLQLAPVVGQQTYPGQEGATPAVVTAWGEPDLQGLWTNKYDTPLQRPAQFADQEFFTDEERSQLDDQRTAVLERDWRPTDSNPLGVGGAYNRAVFLTHKQTGQRTSLIVDPPDGRIPPFTDQAQTRRAEIREYQLALLQATDTCKNNLPGCAGGQYGPPSQRRTESAPHYLTGAVNRADGPEDRNLGERCMLGNLPDFGGAAGFVLQIVQSPGTVSIFYDTGQGQGWQRTIPVTRKDDAGHLSPTVRQWRGDSRGHWEEETLVVNVTNFSHKTDFRGSRENLHLVERWTRLDDETIEYVVTMDDSTTWTKPWTVAIELGRQSNEQNRVYHEPRCHEGNYGLPGLLAGARADEKAFAEGRGPDPATVCSAGCGAGLGDSDPLR
jgi:hypothetical protein